MVGKDTKKARWPPANTFLRAGEYYDMQEIFDDLYTRSQENNLYGVDLYGIITLKNNILLAYRTIKSNTGSKTKGTDGLTIDDYKIIDENKFIEEIQACFADYKPGSVRRVTIPKEDGRTRPLGIPTMRDRLIQQCIKQVLEPICEAKFYPHSYGFRPNRSTRDAMSRCQTLINKSNLHHVVDIDITGFFDNVNHSRLLKQCYNIGIFDRRVLRIISKILKSPIVGEGVPTKGTPQGGIISPILANIVLNDVDWWISKQWENMTTEHLYIRKDTKHKMLKRNSNLKRMYIVRYADDFKVFTDSHENAIKIYHATKGYLQGQLKLEISPQKSKVTNLRRNSTEFLGFSIRAVRKHKKYVAYTHIADKKKIKIQAELKQRIRDIQKQPHRVIEYNVYVLGIHSYYRAATHVNADFSVIAYRLIKTLHNRLKDVGKYGVPINPSDTYKKFYKNSYKTYKVGGTYLYPVADIRHQRNLSFTQSKCDYTPEGRKLLEISQLNPAVIFQIRQLASATTEYTAIEYLDNRLSKYSSQQGCCAITKMFLIADEVHCHHIIPTSQGGTDKFDNLIIVHKAVHVLIHATKSETIMQYIQNLQLTNKEIKTLNEYRKKCNLGEVENEIN